MSTPIDSGLFQHLPSSIKVTTSTATRTLFNTSTQLLGMSSYLSNDDKATASRQNEDSGIGES